jgi:hypothetical protein
LHFLPPSYDNTKTIATPSVPITGTKATSTPTKRVELPTPTPQSSIAADALMHSYSDGRNYSGYWLGQITYYNGQPSSKLSVLFDSATGNSFTGSEVEDDYAPPTTSVYITGQVNGNIVTFTTVSFISGNQQTLGIHFTGTLSGKTINGTWTYPDGKDGGTIFLNQQN